MTATEVLLAAAAHVFRLAGTGLYVLLAWEVRRRPGVWLAIACAAGALACGVQEFLVVGGLYGDAGSPRWPDWTRPLHSLLPLALTAWGITRLRGSLLKWLWIAPSAVAAILPEQAALSIQYLACAILLSWPLAHSEKHGVEKRCLRWMGCCCFGACAALLLPTPNRAAAFALATLCLPAGVLIAIARRNVFGLRLSRNLFLVAMLGLFSSLYLLLIKRVADQLTLAYGQSRSLVEIILILGAALLWLPLYQWMSRWMARRALLQAEFSKRVIEQAASRIELRELVQFLAVSLHRTLNCAGLLLIGRGETLEQAAAGTAHALSETAAEELLAECGRTWEERLDMTSASGWLANWLERTGFHYLLPLRHEGAVVGVLALDCSPYRFMADIDSMFPSMAREISLLLGSARLIKEKLDLEKALAAQESRAVLGDLTATIAHEIKNPLSNIRVLAQLLGEDAEVRQRYETDIRFIIGETDRLNAAVRQLLEFSRQPPEAAAEVDVSALLERVLGAAAVQAGSLRLDIEQQVESGLVLPSADLQGLESLVSNLLRNAVQASPPGGVVRVAASRGESFIRLSVEDEGPGVPEELKARIFQPYFTTRQSGTGLGLAIVSKYLRRLHGTIQVESPVRDGHGTNMVVLLPVEAGA